MPAPCRGVGDARALTHKQVVEVDVPVEEEEEEEVVEEDGEAWA